MTELELTDVNTISIPTDTIILLTLLIIFSLLGFFFHKILNDQTNQFVDKVDKNSSHKLFKEKLKDQLILQSRTANQVRDEKPNIKKLNFLSTAKLFGLSSMTIIAIGGATLLGIQATQNSYKGVNTSTINRKSKNQSTKPFVSMIKVKFLDKGHSKINITNYVDPLLSAVNSYKNNRFYQIKGSKFEDFFSF